MKRTIWFLILMSALSFPQKIVLGADEVADDDSKMKLRVVAVNPSESKVQIVPIKIYLPKEIIPDDIIDMGELKVGYDSARSLYYAFNDEVELQPLETRVFEVHLEDVWMIPELEMDKVREQTGRALKHLENTEYHKKAQEIVDSIQLRLDGIKAKQEDDSVSREVHIGIYRTNQEIMKNIEADIEKLEKLLQFSGAPTSIEFLEDTVFEEDESLDRITAWRLIMAIIGFLGVLGFGFYLRWFLMIRAKRRANTPLEDEPGVDAAQNVSENVEETVSPSASDPFKDVLGDDADKDKQNQKAS